MDERKMGRQTRRSKWASGPKRAGGLEGVEWAGGPERECIGQAAQSMLVGRRP